MLNALDEVVAARAYWLESHPQHSGDVEQMYEHSDGDGSDARGDYDWTINDGYARGDYDWTTNDGYAYGPGSAYDEEGYECEEENEVVTGDEQSPPPSPPQQEMMGAQGWLRLAQGFSQDSSCPAPAQAQPQQQQGDQPWWQGGVEAGSVPPPMLGDPAGKSYNCFISTRRAGCGHGSGPAQAPAQPQVFQP